MKHWPGILSGLRPEEVTERLTDRVRRRKEDVRMHEVLREILFDQDLRARRTLGPDALGDGLLAAAAADAHAVDDIALLGLVAEAAGLVGAAGPRGTVDYVELAKLY